MYLYYSWVFMLFTQISLLFTSPSFQKQACYTEDPPRTKTHHQCIVYGATPRGRGEPGWSRTAFWMQMSISCATTNISKHTYVYSLWHSVSASCRSSCSFPGREKKKTEVIFKGKDWKRKACVQSLIFEAFEKLCCWGDAFSQRETSCRANWSILTFCYPKIAGKNWGVCAAKAISLQHCGGVYSNVLCWCRASAVDIMLGYIKGSTHLFRFKLMMLIRFSELHLYKASYCFWSPDVPAAAFTTKHVFSSRTQK